jgi:hypothetical protein
LNSLLVSEPGCMRKSASPRLRRNALAKLLVRSARPVRDLIAEYALAQRRLIEVATSPDRYLLHPEVAPETYDEFLFRTSGLLRHEPPARARVGC